MPQHGRFRDHIAPERLYLETRWASLVPSAAAAYLLFRLPQGAPPRLAPPIPQQAAADLVSTRNIGYWCARLLRLLPPAAALKAGDYLITHTMPDLSEPLMSAV